MDTEEFTQEIVRLLPVLRSYAYQLTSDAESAKDLLQETALKALNNIHSYKENKNIKGWTRTIMYRTFLNGNNRNIIERDTIEKFHDIYTAERTYCNNVQGITNHYDLYKIQEAISELPDKYSIPFEMHISGFKYNEIAEAMQVPLSIVKNHIHTTRKVLQKKLHELK